MTDTTTEKAFILGIDGVPWKLLKRWTESGKLPNFGQIFEEGVAAPLRSTAPPTTPLAWPSIATGTNPDKHGIYAFHALESQYSRRMYTSADLSRPALWDILSPAIVGNVPMTYPAKKIDGAMVSGMITPEIKDGFTHPPDLRKEIEQEIPEYRIGLDWNSYTDDQEEFIDDIDDLVAARRQLMDKLVKDRDWRLCFFVYTAPDRLQHLVWDEDVILDHYQTLDKIVGDAMQYASENDASLYIVSDHGFGPISTFVNLNTLLADHGYLSRKDDDGTRGSLAKLGVTKSAVMNSLNRIGISDDRLVRHLPKSLVNGVAERIPGDHGLYDVDFKETVAFAYGPGHVYVNDVDRFDNGIVEPSEIDSIKRDVEATLMEASDPETGEQVLNVYDGDDLFPTDPDAPDLVVVGRGEYEQKAKLPDNVFESAGDKAAGHRSQGVFLGWGPDIAPGGAPDDASVVDIAPTVLHDVGEPIPEHADGHVLQSVFASNSPQETQSVTTQLYGDEATEKSVEKNSNERFDGVEDRLRGLGYIE
ncbi:alkaline phosphatase family protein [Natrinema hispanicum]|uniref:Predicted phosphohydrolase or phosphomutase, AlkP superfamily n=1 Tax=Natrinema hispanicum TaxID=392421 RepID=A0A1G6V2D2_9EURY|nr:alkaline phosphatase family protein [Natrinema hispanicum]SDD47653.1 Predicted phosphohydrolase or phosphomutase, AlkP superfamily [Natrinema hispanicum]SEU03626.1 Predicted phosphohydrolase or phosphomutase, AlkP superfamily [Natrinema hispanicum]